jgi:hypothetical protein
MTNAPDPAAAAFEEWTKTAVRPDRYSFLAGYAARSSSDAERIAELEEAITKTLARWRESGVAFLGQTMKPITEALTKGRADV